VLPALLMLVSLQAHAVLLNASYTLDTGDTLTFVLDGTFEANQDTVIVNSLLGTPELNGVAPGLGTVSGLLSMTDAMSGKSLGDPSDVLPRLSVSGANMDLVFYSDYPSDGFYYCTAGAPCNGGGSVYGASLTYGGSETFVADRWSLTRSVPEPGTLSLLAAGLFGLTLRGRRIA
jgi:hypothetical protein